MLSLTFLKKTKAKAVWNNLSKLSTAKAIKVLLAVNLLTSMLVLIIVKFNLLKLAKFHKPILSVL